LAQPDPDTGLDVLVDHLIDEIAHPLAPGLASAASLQANRDPDFARLLTTVDEEILRTITTILRRVEAKPERTLAFPARSTARWIQNLIDASHLGIIGGPRARNARSFAGSSRGSSAGADRRHRHGRAGFIRAVPPLRATLW
jgi:hypothetical protein